MTGGWRISKYEKLDKASPHPQHDQGSIAFVSMVARWLCLPLAAMGSPRRAWEKLRIA